MTYVLCSNCDFFDCFKIYWATHTITKIEHKLVSSCFNQGFNDGKRMFFLIPASFLFFSKTKKYLLLKHICLKYLWKWTVSQVFLESGSVFLATLNYFSENVIATHCVKSVRVRSFSGLYFTVFRLNSKIYKKNYLYSIKIRENTDQKN